MPLTKLNELKNGDVVLKCECGIIHTISFNEETQEIDVESIYIKKEKKENAQLEEPTEKERKTEKRSRLFGKVK